MPGFIVHRVGGHRLKSTGRVQYYYNYYWEISNLFGTNFNEDSPLIALKDANTPTFTVNKESYVGSSLEYKFAKSVTWDDLKVSWYDSDGLLAVLKQWRASVWTPECGLQMANDYKKQSQLTHYLPTGAKVNSWLLVNSWPSQIRSGELTYTSSEIKLVEVTVTYDWAVERPGS